MPLADEAKRRRDTICAAADDARDRFQQMDSVQDAEAYMHLALLATKARDARLALIAAEQEAQSVGPEVAAAAIAEAAATQAHQAANAIHGPVGPEVDHLNVYGDYNQQADLDRGNALLNNAKAIADHADTAVTHANTTLNHGETAADAGLRAVTRTETAVATANGIPNTVAAIPAAPASCTDPLDYNTRIAALNVLQGGIAGETHTLTQSSQQLQVFSNTASATVAAQRGVFAPLETENQNIRALAIYANRAQVRDTRNGFDNDIADSGTLADRSNDLATNTGIVATTVRPDINALTAPAAGLPVDIAPVRARLQRIEDEAREASLLIPYDPGNNSTQANAALDQVELVEVQMARLIREQRQAENNAPRLDRERRDQIARLQRDVVSRRMAVGNAVRNAKKSKFYYLSAAVTVCSLGYVDPTGVSAVEARLTAAEESVTRLEQRPTELQRVNDALAEAQACADAARQAGRQAANRRVAQLTHEGHGPQRHEGDVTTRHLGERAVYRIDPETHTQLDAESGQIHNADASASKFRTNAIYVKAEAKARERSAAARLLDPDADLAANVPLAEIGEDVAVGVTCTNRPPRVATQLGDTEQIPVRPAYNYGPLVDPPTVAQMDQVGMGADIARLTQPTVFADNAEAFAVLREDVNGKVYLRTMWPQNPA